jgi:hypothetical protein
MKKYEYKKVIKVKYPSERYLNRQGKKGWSLVHMEPLDNDQYGLIFKRELPRTGKVKDVIPE